MAVIARVFPRKTKYTPDDDLVFFRPPGLFEQIRGIDEVHVSCVFSWDKKKAEMLARQWKRVCKNVKVGGPAYDDPGGEFIPDMYVKRGYVLTSRGCPRRCSFCLVPSREGKLRELSVQKGSTVFDNNLLACSHGHVESVFDMLNGQRGVTFTGGLDTYFMKDWHIDRLVRLGKCLRYFYIAYDRLEDKDSVESALVSLHDAGLIQDMIGCYVLVGYEGDTIKEADERCEWVFVNGGIPFAMYYRGLYEESSKKPKEWGELTCRWMWISTIYKHMKGEGLRYHDRFVRGKLANNR